MCLDSAPETLQQSCPTAYGTSPLGAHFWRTPLHRPPALSSGNPRFLAQSWAPRDLGRRDLGRRDLSRRDLGRWGFRGGLCVVLILYSLGLSALVPSAFLPLQSTHSLWLVSGSGKLGHRPFEVVVKLCEGLTYLMASVCSP